MPSTLSLVLPAALHSLWRQRAALIDRILRRPPHPALAWAELGRDVLRDIDSEDGSLGAWREQHELARFDRRQRERAGHRNL
ncbi:hypothetical protein [Rhodoferax sp.]|uniref:hypothetical protein n=1 Tax=Rhodoferax sp. TaxID=50421 RepID=UPI00374D8980